MSYSAGAEVADSHFIGKYSRIQTLRPHLNLGRDFWVLRASGIRFHHAIVRYFHELRLNSILYGLNLSLSTPMVRLFSQFKSSVIKSVSPLHCFHSNVSEWNTISWRTESQFSRLSAFAVEVYLPTPSAHFPAWFCIDCIILSWDLVAPIPHSCIA